MFLVDSIDLDVLNPIYIYCFGIAGIVIYLLFIILAIVFIKKDVDLNYVFGYRTPFALSSVKKWKWANNIFMKCLIIGGTCISILVTMFIMGYQKKGFAIGWKVHHIFNREWYFGEVS